MKITRDNYQAYILDYFEGTLSVQEKESLLAFLNAHPDCRKEFEEFENISLSDFEADEDFFSMKYFSLGRLNIGVISLTFFCLNCPVWRRVTVVIVSSLGTGDHGFESPLGCKV